MRTRTQNEVTGNDGLAQFAQDQQRRTRDELECFDSTTIGVRHTTRGKQYYVKSRPQEAPATPAGVVLMSLISYNQSQADGDYLVCRPDGGDSGGADDVNVAVEPQLQSNLGYSGGVYKQKMPDGKTWTFTAYTGQQRTATSDEATPTVLTEYITPPFLVASTGFVADRIPVQPCSNPGVTVSGTALTLVALTGRQWASA